MNYFHTTCPTDQTNIEYTFGSYDGYGQKELEAIEHHENEIHIIYRRKAMFIYTTSSVSINTDGFSENQLQENDILVKEIWGVDDDGKLKLFRTVQGYVVPPQNIPEQFIFNDPEGTENTDPCGSDS